MYKRQVIERLGALSGPEATYVAGVGQHQMWAAQFVQYSRPNSWINSGGLGTMGFAVPAAMGAKVAEPHRTVWAIDGDGSVSYTHLDVYKRQPEHQWTFRGPAKVAESQDAAVEMILAGNVVAGDVVVVRYEGPKGGPGMQEMLYPTSYLKGCLLYTSRCV